MYTPMHTRQKKSNKKYPLKYRLVSQTSIICKLCEMILKNRWVLVWKKILWYHNDSLYSQRYHCVLNLPRFVRGLLILCRREKDGLVASHHHLQPLLVHCRTWPCLVFSTSLSLMLVYSILLWQMLYFNLSTYRSWVATLLLWLSISITSMHDITCSCLFLIYSCFSVLYSAFFS